MTDSHPQQKGRLKQRVAAHLSTKQLSQKQLSQLSRLQQDYSEQAPEAGPADKEQSNSYRYRLGTALAACVCVLGFIFLFSHQVDRTATLPTTTTSIEDRIIAIAQEVAKNHIKLRPLEVSSEHIQPVRDYFSALDFSPIDSDFFRGDTAKLLGGRYCSIQGVTAAQLRYRNHEGQTQSLYEVGYDPERYPGIPNRDKGELPLVVYAKGIKVSLWVEKDLLVVSAESPSD